MQNNTTLNQKIHYFFKNSFNFKQKDSRHLFLIPASLYYIISSIFTFSLSVIYIKIYDIIPLYDGIDITEILFDPATKQIFFITFLIGLLLQIPLFTAIIRRFNDIGFQIKTSIKICVVIIFLSILLKYNTNTTFLTDFIVLFLVLRPTNYLSYITPENPHK